MIALLAALLTAVIYCAIVLVVAWLCTVLIGFIPMPAPIKDVVAKIIWVIAVIICLLILLSVIAGGPLSLLLVPLAGLAL